jgi:hypothetical protein
MIWIKNISEQKEENAGRSHFFREMVPHVGCRTGGSLIAGLMIGAAAAEGSNVEQLMRGAVPLPEGVYFKESISSEVYPALPSSTAISFSAPGMEVIKKLKCSVVRKMTDVQDAGRRIVVPFPIFRAKPSPAISIDPRSAVTILQEERIGNVNAPDDHN